jgi:phage terminase large subunit
VTALRIDTARAFQPLLAPARYKGARGGRGSAKSHFFAGLMIEESITQKMDCVCLRETQKSLQFSVKKLLESKIEAMNAGYYFEVQDKRILSKQGGVIIFEGMQNQTAESIKSLENFKRAWFEEAQTCSQRSLDMLRPTIRAPDSEMWFSWNPTKPTDPVDAFFAQKPEPPDSVLVNVSYRDNPWLPTVLTDEIQYDQRRDPDKFAHIWLGGYQEHSGSRVFTNWSVEEFDTPAGVNFRMGADWGFANDPACLVRGWTEGRKLYVDYEAWMIGCEIDQLPDLFDRVPDSRKWFITADSARPETISYMQKHGYPKINAAIKGARSLEEGVEFLKSFDIVVHPRCTHVIDELASYSYKLDPDTEKVLPLLEDKHNHTIDALRYACEGLRRGQKRPVVQRTFVEPVGWMA